MIGWSSASRIAVMFTGGAIRWSSASTCSPVPGSTYACPAVVQLPRRSRVRARILYMTTLPLAEVRANLSKLVDEAVRTHQRIEVTRQGRRAAVILSADDFDSIMETLAILSDQELMRDVRSAEAEAEKGEICTFDEVTEEMRAAGRLPR